MPHDFQVSCKGVLINKDKVLVLRGCIPSGECFWDLPGGRMEKKEQPAVALAREVQEELPSAKDVETKELLHADIGYHLEDLRDIVIVFYRFEATLGSITLTDEHTGFEWFTRDEVQTLEQDSGTSFFDAGTDVAIKRAFELQRKPID